MRSLSEALSPDERQILEDVEQLGIHIAMAEDAERPFVYAYTVGLWHRCGQPEVLVAGLPGKVAKELLDLVADEVFEERNFDAGSEADDLLAGFSARFVDVPVAEIERLMPVATWAYASEPFPVVQLVYPDKHGNWPWAETALGGFVAAQPVFGSWSDAT
jgi:hypothetical protein